MERVMKRKLEQLDEGEQEKLRTLLRDQKKQDRASDDPKLGWMYKQDKPEKEEYLLGRKIDSHIDNIQEQEDQAIKETPGAIFADAMARRADLDMHAKMREDPLYAIRKREEDARRKIVENPIKMKQLQKLVEEQEKKETKKKEKKRKKHKKHHKKADSSGSDDSDSELLQQYLAIVKSKGSKDKDESRGNKRDSRGDKRDSRGDKRDSKGYKRDSRGDKRESRGNKHDSRGNKHDSRGDKCESRGDKHDSKSDRHDFRGDRHESKGNRHDSRGDKHESKSDRHDSRSDRHESRVDKFDSRNRDLNIDTHKSHKNRHKSRSRSPEPPRHSESAKQRHGADSDSDSDREKKSKARQYGLIVRLGVLAGYQLGKKSSPHRKRSRSRSRSPKPQPKLKSKEVALPQKREPKKRLTAEEMDRRRQEMLENARWRDEQRETNVARYREEDKKDKESTENLKRAKSNFLNPLMMSHATSSSVEDRLKRNKYNIQRTRADLDKNFTKH